MNDTCNQSLPAIILGYRGGSGGFFLLHLLLISNKYHVDFEFGKSFKEILLEQWQITNADFWKLTETWPNNYQTAMSTTKRQKILFYNNPTKQEFFQNPYDIVPCYYDVKDDTWPEISCFQDYENLPNDIKQECELSHGLFHRVQWCRQWQSARRIWLYTDVYSQNELAFYKKAYHYVNKNNQHKTSIQSQPWHGFMIDAAAIDFLECSDTILNLQNIINRPDLLVMTKLLDAITESHLDFITRWCSLHPQDLLADIGILPLAQCGFVASKD